MLLSKILKRAPHTKYEGKINMPSSSISGATSILLTDQYPLNTSSMGSNKCKRTRSPHYRETFNLNLKKWNVLIHNQGQNWMLHTIMQSDLKRVNSFTWSHSLLFPNPKARGSTWVQIGPNETLPPGTLCVCVCVCVRTRFTGPV